MRSFDIRIVDSEDDNIRRTVLHENAEPWSATHNATDEDLEALFWELYELLGKDMHG